MRYLGHDGLAKKNEPVKKKPKLDPIPEIEEHILSVINEAETEDKKLTVTDIKNRAVAFAKENGNPTFNPSKGWILRFLQRHGKKLPEKNKNSKGEEVRTRNQFSLAEKHEVAKYIVENQNVLAKDVAVIFTEKFAKPLTADTVRRIKSEGIYIKSFSNSLNPSLGSRVYLKHVSSIQCIFTLLPQTRKIQQRFSGPYISTTKPICYYDFTPTQPI